MSVCSKINAQHTNYLAATESICPTALWVTFEPGRQPHLGQRVDVMATPWTPVAPTQVVFETPVNKEADVSGPSGMFGEMKEGALQVLRLYVPKPKMLSIPERIILMTPCMLCTNML